MRHRRRSRCGCPRPNCGCQKPIVHPVKENVVHCCTEETVQHVHPSHTTVMNHHLVKNEHFFPHTTSTENTFQEVDVYGGPRPPFGAGPGNQVAGATSPGQQGQGMGPGMGTGMGPGGQVAGAGTQGPGYCCPPQGMKHSHKPHHWR